MARMPQEVQDLFNEVGSVVFSTASADGQPNSCIVGMRKILDDETIYLSDQFFNKTLANVRENDKGAVVFWGEQGAYEVHGTMTYINEGEQFDELAAWANARFAEKGMPITAKGGVLFHVERVYTSAPGPTAGDQIA